MWWITFIVGIFLAVIGVCTILFVGILIIGRHLYKKPRVLHRHKNVRVKPIKKTTTLTTNNFAEHAL